jgi:hypothetical protein
MLALSVFTAGQRFVKVWRQATSDRNVPVSPAVDRRRLARSARRSDRRQRHGSWRPSSRS